MQELGKRDWQINYQNFPLFQLLIPSRWLIFMTAAFLVSVPVFVEAPLVRSLPLVSLLSTGLWIGLAIILIKQQNRQLWGDLILGFSWSWLAGSIYWGWWRWEPLYHLPIEAIGLPFAIWCLYKKRFLVGTLFYLGSLLGTVITDVYFYVVGLIEAWKQLMIVDPALATPILQNAIASVYTPWGIAWGIVLGNFLLLVGILCLGTKQLHWYAFSGAVLTTIIVDFLFLLVASNI